MGPVASGQASEMISRDWPARPQQGSGEFRATKDFATFGAILATGPKKPRMHAEVAEQARRRRRKNWLLLWTYVGAEQDCRSEISAFEREDSMDSLRRTLFPFFVPALLTAVGCSSDGGIAGPEVAKLRQQYTLSEEPDGVQTVSEVRTELTGEEAPDVLALIEHDHGSEDDGAEGEAAVDEHAAHEHAEGEAGHIVQEEAGHDHEGEGHDHASHAEGEHAEHEDHHHATTGEHPEELEVVLVGIVGGVPNPAEQAFADFPFAEGKAMFILADPEAVAELEEHGHNHAPGEECAFCAAHAADAQELIAAVTFADNDGKVLAVDSRELFDLKEKDAVVVKGTAKLAPGAKFLQVEATGIYVRR
jgi:hypothetical protein